MAISKKTLQLLKEARCADISDAMDSMGLQDLYSMTPEMRPLVPQTGFCGIARTLEFVKTDQRLPYMDYKDFEKLQYAKKKDGGYLFLDNLHDPSLSEKVNEFFRFNTGTEDVVVADCHGLIGGIFGSENAMKFMAAGVVGLVLDGYMRDTDECILENVPVFSRGISYVHPQGRIQIAAVSQPVVCGGVTVSEGDVIRADHDGIIVIPEKHADEAAYRAYQIQKIDRVFRRESYEKAGKAFDETVELLPALERWF